MRGGTSKGLFVHERDVPPAGGERDAMLLRIMGSPDPMQIDGLGGTFSSTSKVVVVSPSEREDWDVEYLFGQVEVDRAHIDWSGNCGNLTSAVGPFAIEEGIVAAGRSSTHVRMLNRNTSKRIDSFVPTQDGRVVVNGSHRIAGVPGTGARIVNTYLAPGCAVFAAVLPTGRPTDMLAVAGVGDVAVSVVDVAHPYAYVASADLGIDPATSVAALNADPSLLSRLEAVRATCAQFLGRAESVAAASEISPIIPRLALVGPASTWYAARESDSTSGGGGASVVDLSVRMVSMGKVHRACPMTGVVCTAAAVGLPGTVPAQLATAHQSGEPVRIGHPKGVAEAAVRISSGDRGPTVESVTVTRTARRLMAGTAYYPAVAAPR